MKDWIRKTKLALRRMFKKEPPEDPYAWAGAPRKPRPPLRSARAAVEEPE